MSNLYLIRHGQAGTRKAYDSLSELGRRQARLLGQYFASQGLKFAGVYSGELSRQLQTAEGVRTAYGEGVPGVAIDSGWNEFDLDRMYRELAPQLCAADPEFRREYEAMRIQLQEDDARLADDVNRRWLPSDSSVVSAWISATHRYSGETWQQFRGRVSAAQQRLSSAQRGENIMVFTSATPIAICTGLALDIGDERLMKLAGVLHNASFTVLQLRNDGMRMFSFNNMPHLTSSDLRTFR